MDIIVPATKASFDYYLKTLDKKLYLIDQIFHYTHLMDGLINKTLKI